MSTSSSSSPAVSETTSPSVVNIAAYRFVALDNLPDRRETLRSLCHQEELKGTILLSPEGINLFVAGSRSGIDRLLAEIREIPGLADIEVKESYSHEQPFERMLVKLKREIIAFGVENIEPGRYTSPKLPAEVLRDWLDNQREVVLLDVRNDYEVKVGTFKNALPIGVDHFRDFPAAVEQLPEEIRERPVVMFCTGGIRCEKAGPFMERAGFRHVYQLEGGILKYFEECGGAHYEGDCFVFDKRVAVDPQLKETPVTQCYACQEPLLPADQESPLYVPGESCPHCYQTPAERMRSQIETREAAICEHVTPLPGSVPYDNERPLSVPARFDGLSLIDFLTSYHPHISREEWEQTVLAGHIMLNHRPVGLDRIVRGGERYAHILPGWVDPPVNADIRIVHDDDALTVINKPAPLPMHPSGRFHRNSLESILNHVFHPLKLRPAHRLDANTTGVVVLSKTRYVAREVQPQFEQQTVRKVYLARVHGHPAWDRTLCEASIANQPGECGGRGIDPDGLPATTEFEVLERLEDGTSLVRALPRTGRTNQIRIHLWHLGHAIAGDPLYRRDGSFGQQQTLTPDDEPMCLHALEVTIQHPSTNESVTYRADAPSWARGTSRS